MALRLYNVTARDRFTQKTIANVQPGDGERLSFEPQGARFYYVRMTMGTITGSVSLVDYDGLVTTSMSDCRVLAVLSTGKNPAARAPSARFAWGTLCHLGGGILRYVAWDRLAARHRAIGGEHFGLLFTNRALEDPREYEEVFATFGIGAGARFVYQANTNGCDVGFDRHGRFGEIPMRLVNAGEKFPAPIGSQMQSAGRNGWDYL